MLSAGIFTTHSNNRVFFLMNSLKEKGVVRFDIIQV